MILVRFKRLYLKIDYYNLIIGGVWGICMSGCLLLCFPPDSLLQLMTTDEKLLMLGVVDWMYTHEVERLGIPRMRMSDGPQGLGTYGKSTAYPATVMLAATWNKDLARQYGYGLGRDCRGRRNFRQYKPLRQTAHDF